MRGGVGSEIDRYEETEVRLRDFSAAIDAMLADETLWAIPSLPDGTPDAAKLLPFIQELFRRVVGEAGRTGIPAT